MILYRYIAKTIFSAVLIVLLIFTGLLAFANLLGELHQIGSGHYGFPQALLYVLMTLPSFIYQIFPTIILIGVLVGLGALASSSELAVMRTSGFSLFKIANAVLLSGVMMIVLMTLVGEGAAPQLTQQANRLKTNASSQSQALMTLYGVWLKEDNDFYAIKTVQTAHQLFDITRFHFDDAHQLLSSSHATDAEKINGNWQFHGVNTTTFKGTSTTVSQSAIEQWPLDFDLQQFADIDPQSSSLLEIHRQLDETSTGDSLRQQLQTSFWNRIIQPIMTIIMMLVAIPFVFGPLRSVSIGLRLLSGIVVGLVFYIMNQFLTQFAVVYQVPPMYAAMILPTVFLGFSIFLFWWKA